MSILFINNDIIEVDDNPFLCLGTASVGPNYFQMSKKSLKTLKIIRVLHNPMIINLMGFQNNMEHATLLY